MATSFLELKKQRSSMFEKLNKQLQETNTYEKDDSYWMPTLDKSGTGMATIRFLPPSANEDISFKEIYDHGFKGPSGKWYIEKSLTTLKLPDPVSEYNTKLWNSGVESDKEIARKYKRRKSFHTNILVIRDDANPASEGKVYRFKLGVKLWDKIKDVMNPQFADEEPINPFDFWEGADFKLKIKTVDGYRNYDKSEFASPGPVKDKTGRELTDEEGDKIWNSQYSLEELTNPKHFKSYEALKAKFYSIIGDTNDNAFTHTEEETPEPSKTAKSTIVEKSDPAPMDEDDDDELAFFKRLDSED